MNYSTTPPPDRIPEPTPEDLVLSLSDLASLYPIAGLDAQLLTRRLASASRRADAAESRARAAEAERDGLAGKLARHERLDTATRCHKYLTDCGVPDGNPTDGYPELDERIARVLESKAAAEADAGRLRKRLEMVLLFCNTDGSPCDGFRFREEVLAARAALAER